MHNKGNNAINSIDGQGTLALIHIFHPVTKTIWQQVDRGEFSPEEEESKEGKRGYLFALFC